MVTLEYVGVALFSMNGPVPIGCTPKLFTPSRSNTRFGTIDS